MTTFKPAYRLRVYAPRSVDPTEATVLTPTGGAPHSDPFQVASISGVAGYKPYLMDVPLGRRGRIDLLTRKLDLGTLSFTLIDKTLNAGDNLTRWWNAFFGDAKGRPYGRLRVEVDESLDGGGAWPIFATMEVASSKLIQKNEITLNLRDRVELLKMRVFVGQPSAAITYVSQPTLLPIGFRGAAYGKLLATRPLTGAAVQTVFNGVNYTPSAECVIALDATSRRDKSKNILTKNLLEALPPHAWTHAIGEGVIDTQFQPNFSGTARCHLKRLDTNAEGDFRVGGLQVKKDFSKPPNHEQVILFYLHELAAGDVGYMAVPPNGTSVELHIFTDQAATAAQPLLIGDVDPATYIIDQCAGKFAYLYRSPEPLPAGKAYGDPQRTIATNGISALVGTRPPMRRPAKEPSDVLTEVEQVCLENFWAPYLDKQGRLNVVDLRLPTSLAGVATLTDADVVADSDPEWEHDPTQAILRLELAQYSERLVTGEVDLWSSPESIPEFPGASFAFEETKHVLEPLYIGSIDYGDRSYKIDAKGYRSMDGEQHQSQPRSTYLENSLGEMGNQMQRPFAYGLITIPLVCRRTSTVTGLAQGGLAICTASVVPDPATHKRGGSRVLRILEITEDGPTIQLRAVDISVNLFATAPTIGAPAQETGNTYGGVTVAVTLNASSQPVVVRYAVTDTATAVAPVDTSPLWTYAGTKDANGIRFLRRRLGTGTTFAIRGCPPGKRIWVDGRSEPLGSDAQLPSAWVIAGGAGYVDTAALPTPSGLGESHTNKTAHITFTPGASDLPIEILMATPTSDPRRRVGIADAGSTSFDLTNLDPSTTYRVEVRLMLGEHVGAGATIDVATGSSGTACPDIVALTVLSETG